MRRLEWMQTKNGWHCDPYQIELLAPGYWVLSRHPSHARWPGLIASGNSLKGLKRRAWHFEAQKQGRRRLISNSAWLLAMIFVAAALRPVPALLAAAVVLVFLLALRVIGFWVGMATGRGWNRLADTYQ